MTTVQKLVEFWDFLNEMGSNTPIGFNSKCIRNAERIGLDANLMNSLISAWACTLNKDFPIHVLKVNNLWETPRESLR